MEIENSTQNTRLDDKPCQYEVFSKVVDLYKKLLKYTLNPKTHQNPLRKLKLLQNVTFDPQTAEYKFSSILKKKQKNIFENFFSFDKNFKNYSNNIPSILTFMVIIKEILLCIKTNERINKREIYYKNVQLFENQDSIDTAIKKICFLLKIPRRVLKIVNFFL